MEGDPETHACRRAGGCAQCDRSYFRLQLDRQREFWVEGAKAQTTRRLGLQAAWEEVAGEKGQPEAKGEAAQSPAGWAGGKVTAWL